MSILAFLSYSRASSRWIAQAIRERLVAMGADVFMDTKDISSGHFENVISNEIARRSAFLVVLSPETLGLLDTETNWVRRELELALELRKNVIPILVEGANIRDTPRLFPNREMFVGLQALVLSFDYFDEAMEVLFGRYLLNPTIQELEFETAEAHFRKAVAFRNEEDWKAAEVEFARAASRHRRAEYLLGLAAVKHKQGRNLEALQDVEAAIALDPFERELMIAKCNLLQHIDRMEEALDLARRWPRQAEQVAMSCLRRILAATESGLDLPDAVRKVPELMALFAHMPEYGLVFASVQALMEHIPDAEKEALRESSQAWRRENDDKRREWEEWEARHPD